MSTQTSLLQELIIDNFAGGGGASTGIELATGRPVDIAINHDPDAILMHKTNHPYTEHIQASVWDVDPITVCRGRPVGLAWFSPDCKHFSKAKGSKPVDKNIRGLAWIVLRWAGAVRPQVIILENVEEFRTWGPVRNGRPIKAKAGTTFQKWLQQLQDLGYTVEWQELVAADYGAPTTRKRFFLIARCDGEAIVWPEPSHAPANSPAVVSGKKKAWRSAAEIIDWTLPTPSIFGSKANIKQQYGITAVRPLADNTMRRVICGVEKFVIKSAEPFIVPIGYGEAKGQHPRTHDINAPMPTSVGKAKHGLVRPVIAPLTMHNNQNAVGTDITDPVNTITAGGAGGHQMLISPSLVQCKFDNAPENIIEPLRTITSVNAHMLITPTIIQYHTEQKNEHHRGQQVTDPIMTVDAANRYGMVAPTFVKYYGNDTHGQDIQSPLHTITAKDREGLILPHLVKMKGDNLGSHMQSPVQTITAGGGHFGVVTTKVMQITTDADLHYWPEIRGLLNQYCSYNLEADEIILFDIDGIWYYMADIGLRMLSPRELYAANGFPPDYIIDRDYTGKEYGKTKQVARCGNAVPPPFAVALVRANCPTMCDTLQPVETMEQLGQIVAS